MANEEYIDKNASKYKFVVETYRTYDGKELKSVKPNKDGWYEGVPVAVLGKPSDNDASYDTESFVRSMKEDPFNRRLAMGGLRGEIQHPDLPMGALSPKDLKRLLTIDQTLVASQFKKVYTAEELPKGGVIIRADIKPFGPYAEMTEMSLRDPDIGAAWSLRAMVSETTDRNGMKMRYIGRLVTFDNVDIGGYAEASKYYIPATESIDLNVEDYLIRDEETGVIAACEELKDLDVLKIFGVKEMTIERKVIGIRTNHNTYNDGSCNRSIFHEVSRRKR
jgi:hypothetical protein